MGPYKNTPQEELVKHTITAGQHQIHNFISRDVCFFFPEMRLAFLLRQKVRTIKRGFEISQELLVKSPFRELAKLGSTH